MNYKTTALGIMLTTGLAAAQPTTIDVNQMIDEQDLSSGSFMGQDFTLNPSTVFNINDGGVFGMSNYDFNGSTVNINNGGFFDRSSTVSNVTLNVFDGGKMGRELSFFNNSTINIFGGDVGRNFNAFGGSVINLSGGNLRREFFAHVGSQVNISGGTVGRDFIAFSGSFVNISGGSIGNNFNASSGSIVDISGGTIGNRFQAAERSEINLFVLDASVDGNNLGLSIGETMEIDQRNGALFEATLADGSFFDLTLNDTFSNGMDFVGSSASFAVTRIDQIPSPGAISLISMAGLLAARRRR